MGRTTQTQEQSKIVRRKDGIWTLHDGRLIGFTLQPYGPGNYQNLGKRILESNQEVPHGDYTASFLHSVYCDNEIINDPEAVNARNVMKDNWLSVYNRNLITDKAFYVIQDDLAIGRSKELTIEDLEEMLKGGKELSLGGIRFSQDGKIRYAPKGSYRFGEHTSETLAKDGIIIASLGQEGAEKFGEASATLINKHYIYGVEVKEGQNPELRVSAVDEHDNRLRFYCNKFSDDYRYLAFGVLK